VLKIVNVVWSVGLACILSLCMRAAVVPSLDLQTLVANSDVVVVGVLELHQGISPNGDRNPGEGPQLRTGVVHVDQILKGRINVGTVEVQESLSEESQGYSSIPIDKCRIVFLRYRNDGRYEVTSPYYPSVVGICGYHSSANADLDRVIDQLGAVLSAKSSVPQDRVEAINDLATVENSNVIGVLKKALENEDRLTRVSASAMLLLQNNISGLEIADTALRSGESDLPSFLRHNLLYGISEGIKDERAIHMLDRLLHLPESDTRRAAASALRHIGSKAAIDPLISALWDVDFDVRYYAVIGLAEITRESDRRPLMDEFKEHEQSYLTYWRNWSRSK
jgi:hypothetical protein